MEQYYTYSEGKKVIEIPTLNGKIASLDGRLPSLIMSLYQVTNIL